MCVWLDVGGSWVEEANYSVSLTPSEMFLSTTSLNRWRPTDWEPSASPTRTLSPVCDTSVNVLHSCFWCLLRSDARNIAWQWHLHNTSVLQSVCLAVCAGAGVSKYLAKLTIWQTAVFSDHQCHAATFPLMSTQWLNTTVSSSNFVHRALTSSTAVDQNRTMRYCTEQTASVRQNVRQTMTRSKQCSSQTQQQTRTTVSECLSGCRWWWHERGAADVWAKLGRRGLHHFKLDVYLCRRHWRPCPTRGQWLSERVLCQSPVTAVHYQSVYQCGLETVLVAFLIVALCCVYAGSWCHPKVPAVWYNCSHGNWWQRQYSSQYCNEVRHTAKWRWLPCSWWQGVQPTHQIFAWWAGLFPVHTA